MNLIKNIRCLLGVVFFLALALCFDCNASQYRIVSLAPNATEILFALGLGDEIAGVDDYSNYPEGARHIEKLGSFSNPDIEKILLLKPDYLLISAEFDKDKKEFFEKQGIEIIKVSPKSFNELLGDIKRLGIIFQKEEMSKALLDDINKRLEIVSKNILPKRPKVFIQLHNDPLITVSAFIGDLVSLAGGDNIAWDVLDDASIFSIEKVIERDPDIIILAGFSKEIDLPPIISAIKNNRVYSDLNVDILLRPGPRSINAIEELNKIFYEQDQNI